MTHLQSRRAVERRPLQTSASTSRDRAESATKGSRARRWNAGISWATVTWFTLIHLGALAAPFFFTWKGLLLAVVLAWITGGLGICLGYHRLLTHGSFRTYRPLERLIAILGVLAGEGPPVFWVAQHRKHHQFSDQQGDPHSPRDGAWWSHMFWLFPRDERQWRAEAKRYAPDMLKDPFMRFLDRSFLIWHILLGAAIFTVGWALWDWYTGVSLVAFGMFVRLVYVLHITWAVNSATHMWGYRNYATKDNSRNLWWVGLLAFGEGWHNNHHAFQRSARHGHRWWEIDVTYMAIRTMEICGLVWNVVRDYPRGQDRAVATGIAGPQ
jgi:stearoyl-CoA desaturase (delta-9 desaturase)